MDFYRNWAVNYIERSLWNKVVIQKTVDACILVKSFALPPIVMFEIVFYSNERLLSNKKTRKRMFNLIQMIYNVFVAKEEDEEEKEKTIKLQE